MLDLEREVIERKRAEEKVKEQNKFLKDVMCSLTHPFYVIDANNYRIIFGNAVTGWSDNVKELKCYELSHKREKPCSEKEHPCPLKKVIETKMPMVVEHTHYDKDGNMRNVEIHAYPILDGKGSVVQVIEYSLDITERREAEEELVRESNLLRTLINNLPDFIYIKDTDSRFIDANVAVAHFMRVEKIDELIGKTDFDFYPKELAERFYKDEQEIIHSGKAIIQREDPDIDFTDRFRWLSTTKVPFRDSNGNIVGVVGIGHDITKQKQREEELRKLSLAVEQSPAATVVTDMKGDIEYVNPKFTEVTGYTYEEMIGKNPRILKSGEHPHDFYEELWDTITSGEEWRGEFHNKNKNGELYWVSSSVSAIRDSGGKISHYLAVQEDITEKKLLERQLIKAQEMEAIGTLAGGIAHDFNNLLGVIIGYSDYLLTTLDKDDQMHKIIENINEAGHWGASLTDQLLAFSRKQTIQREILALNTVVEETEKMLKRLLGEDIELFSDLEPELWLVEADHGQITQILMNLSINARDAMTEGGKIIIKTENVYINDEFCQRFSYAQPGKFVCLLIEDKGIGMDQDILSHIFDPFFTTKEIGKGTGLGLSVIYGIVKQHNGWVNVESELGQGSVFRVYLPASFTSGVKETEQEISIEELQGHGERVLLVEDQKMLHDFAARILPKNGYIIFAAEKAEEALDLFEKEKGQFHIVLTDVVLPDMNGVKLADRLLIKKPEIKVLLTSGYMDDKSQWSVIQERGLNFLKKPYTLTELLKSIKEALK
jgi:PAS domain S-box-containing protein